MIVMVKIEDLKVGNTYTIEEVKGVLRNLKDIRRFGLDRADAWKSRKITTSIDELLPDEEGDFRNMADRGWNEIICFDEERESNGTTVLSKKFEYIPCKSFSAQKPLFIYRGKTIGY
jgi:hypothetical protein